jgi:quercetin dioxygenase-like cupin family protein
MALWTMPLHAEAPSAKTDAAKPVVVRPVMSATTTSSGQPIVLPQKDAQVVVSAYEIAPGAVLPVHKHPFPRYAYVQAGNLRVTNNDTGKSEDFKPGDFIVEAVGQWHFGTIDMVEKGKPNTVLRHAH